MRDKILRSANAKCHYFYFFSIKINKGELPLMHSCVFWCKFINWFSRFFWLLLRDPPPPPQKNRLNRWIYQKNTNTHRNTSKVSLLYSFYWKKVKIMIFSFRRPQYFISHTNSQRSLVGRHRLFCKEVNLHNTLVTWAWSAREYTSIYMP